MKSRDTELNRFARALEQIPLLGPTPSQVPVDEKEFRQKYFTTKGALHNSYYNHMVNSWQVKLYLCEGQRVLGYAKSGLKSARFADMAIIHFWKYRARCRRPIEDSDLNFGVEYAYEDLKRNPCAEELLSTIEKHFRANYNLVTSEEAQPTFKAGVLLRKSVQWRRDVEDAISFLPKKYPDLNSYKHTYEMLIETLDQQGKLIESLVKLLGDQPILDSEKRQRAELAERMEKERAERSARSHQRDELGCRRFGPIPKANDKQTTTQQS